MMDWFWRIKSCSELLFLVWRIGNHRSRSIFRLLCTLFFIAGPGYRVFSQPPLPTPGIAEQQLETIAANEELETEDDSFVQSMRQYLEDPVDLNTDDLSELMELNIFTALQLQQIVNYRRLLGNFISIYELQAVPGIDLQLITRLLPYITIKDSGNLFNSATRRLKGGSHTIVARISQVLEPQKGLQVDPATHQPAWAGSAQRVFLRYKYQFKNLLQYGVVADKDAGEQLFRGKQKSGFDYYSVHLFVRNIGFIKSLALGDFTVNLGQGLTQWQSMAFRKSSDVTNIKRQLAVLRPYNSAGEINFHRGIGITLCRNNFQMTAFVSLRKLDGNLVPDSIDLGGHISSLQTSGLHRTQAELADRGVQRQFAMGGNLSYSSSRFHLGMNAVHYQWKLPIRKQNLPYNGFALSGKNLVNFSTDYSYSYRNFHFFGELAFTHHFDKAFINGLVFSADPKIDMSLLFRSIDKSYQSLNSNAFTENTAPTNEKGVYAGITIRPSNAWRVDAYCDFYEFPFLKYLVNAPSGGSDYLLQVSYRPNKQTDLYLRLRAESKSKNFQAGGLALAGVGAQPRQTIRYHVNFKINSALTLRNRAEICRFDKNGTEAQNGFLTFVDLVFKPLKKKYGGSCRWQYFDTDGYDSRLYAYENDVLYSFSVPVFYQQGYRYYVNLEFTINKKLSVWIRWAQVVYKGQTEIGTGLDQIAGNKRSEVKMQAQYQF